MGVSSRNLYGPLDELVMMMLFRYDCCFCCVIRDLTVLRSSRGGACQCEHQHNRYRENCQGVCERGRGAR